MCFVQHQLFIFWNGPRLTSKVLIKGHKIYRMGNRRISKPGQSRSPAWVTRGKLSGQRRDGVTEERQGTAWIHRTMHHWEGKASVTDMSTGGLFEMQEWREVGWEVRMGEWDGEREHKVSSWCQGALEFSGVIMWKVHTSMSKSDKILCESSSERTCLGTCSWVPTPHCLDFHLRLGTVFTVWDTNNLCKLLTHRC
jgi:hypothetical protein